MPTESDREISKLKRELSLYKQTFEQYKNIDKKYNEVVDKLKESKETLELKVQERTKDLKEKQRFLESIVNGIEDPVIVINKDYSINMMNRVVKDYIHEEHIKDKNSPKCYEVLQYRDAPCPLSFIDCPLKKIISTKESTKTLYCRVMYLDSPREIEAISSPLFDDENDCYGIIQVHRDITEHVQTRRDLEKQKNEFNYQAHFDTLTDLPNRLFFNEELLHTVKKSQRDKTKIALLFIDLDRFKEVNDTLGHACGDRVLQESALRIKKTLRANDTLFRLGGDEFTVIMENISNPEDASKLAQRIVVELENPMKIRHNTIYISSSIGISIYPDDALNTSDLIRYADSAMYKAKEDGRNNFKFYSSELGKKVTEKFDLEVSIRNALQNKEFVVYYQPQVEATTNRLLGVEALVRWMHPTLGLITPDKFIKIAEETGLVINIDDEVMHMAMEQISLWRHNNLNPGTLALNVSVKQLENKHFVQKLKETMKKFDCNPEYLEIEVTESNIMKKPQENIVKLNILHKLGIKIAVDDFGTGYSSLSYLKKFPISKLKIDQSFIRELPENEDDSAITKAVIALSESLHLQIIAEGVETKEQKDFLIQNSCPNIQGYYYSKPLSSKDMEAFLRKSSL
ncbi:EAL domain-containing protein [bacterium]|nr:EAL domain-containing protein [bacterium]MBU1434639.1 EAL domain-containing protein [bacterium]MBU1502217.1 EAL domain-containing protein [bacterium]